jgi:hypothetical protein
MKRKDLKAYIRTEIINELNINESNTDTIMYGRESNSKIKAIKQLKTTKTFKDLKPQEKIETEDNIKKDTDGGILTVQTESDLNEARKAYRIGDTSKFAEAKELYNAGLYADLLKAVEEAGEEGITQKELGIKLGKGDGGSSLNLTLNKFKDIGVLDGGKLAAAEKPEAEVEPEIGDEMDDEFYKDEEETKPETKPETAPEEKPEIEKVAGKTQATKLSPEDEDRYTKLKKGIDAKMARLKDMSAEKRGASDDMKSLKQLVNRKDIIDLFKAKGVDVKDLISDL